MKIQLNIEPEDLTLIGVRWAGDYWEIERVEYNGIELDESQYNDDDLQNWLDEVNRPDYLNDPFSLAA